MRFLTFTDLYGLDTDILITFLSVLRIYPYKSVKVKNRKCPDTKNLYFEHIVFVVTHEHNVWYLVVQGDAGKPALSCYDIAHAYCNCCINSGH